MEAEEGSEDDDLECENGLNSRGLAKESYKDEDLVPKANRLDGGFIDKLADRCVKAE